MICNVVIVSFVSLIVFGVLSRFVETDLSTKIVAVLGGLSMLVFGLSFIIFLCGGCNINEDCDEPEGKPYYTINYDNGYREEVYVAGPADTTFCDTIQVIKLADGKKVVSEEFYGCIKKYRKINNDYFVCRIDLKNGGRSNFSIKSNYVNVINH